MLNQLCMSEINFTWLWCITLLYIAVWYGNIVLGAFVSVLMEGYGSVISLRTSLSGFGTRVITLASQQFGKCPFLPFVGRVYKVDVIFNLIFWRIYHWSHKAETKRDLGAFQWRYCGSWQIQDYSFCFFVKNLKSCIF